MMDEATPESNPALPPAERLAADGRGERAPAVRQTLTPYRLKPPGKRRQYPGYEFQRRQGNDGVLDVWEHRKPGGDWQGLSGLTDVTRHDLEPCDDATGPAAEADAEAPSEPTYSTARTAAEILEAVARAIWWNKHGGEAYPGDRIPTEKDLYECPVELVAEEGQDARLMPARFSIDLEWGNEADAIAADPRTARRRIVPPLILWAYDASDEKNGRPPRLVTLESEHARWLAQPADERGAHPAYDLVTAWQEWKARQPVQATRNSRPDRTLPAKVAMIRSNDNRAGRLFASALHSPDGQLVMPGFGDYLPLATPALYLALYDLGVGNIATRGGHGAPLALRLWVEAVLSVKIPDRRRNHPVAMEIPLRELLAKLYPGQRPSPARYWPRLMAAVEALQSNAALVPWEDPDTGKGGLRRVVSVSNIPRGAGALDDAVRVIVDLPPGAHKGPVVSPSLPKWGVKSAAAYRALIGLAFRWWQPGITRRPVRQGRNRYWYQSDNPKDYGGELTDDEAIALCFPTSARSERRKLASEAWKVLGMLVDNGEAREVDGILLPPKGGYGRQE